MGFWLPTVTLIGLVMAGPSAGQQPKEPPPTPVSVSPAREKDVTPIIELVGTARALRTSRVAAEVDGLVARLLVSLGDPVKQGDVLVELDRGNMELALKAARAQAAAAGIKLEEARRDLARSASLNASKTIAVQKYDRDRFLVMNLEQTVAAAQAEADRLADRIARMTVRAPFDGFVAEKHTEVGQWLSSGAAVVTLLDLSSVLVRVYLPERYLTWVSAGAPAEVTFEALGEQVFKGQVAAVIPQADERARNLPVEITLDNPEGSIRAGLSARVNIRGPERKAMVVPKDALVLSEEGVTVYVVKGGEAFPVQVTMGLSHEGDVEVTGDIAPGQQVVTQGNERLRPGQKVRTAEPKDAGKPPEKSRPPSENKPD